MTRNEWKKKIEKACRDAGTYRSFFNETIEQLASILEIRDEARVQYQKSGNSPVIKYTNEGGHTNLKKNPALVVINEENQLALAYWRDLGLTPAGYKKLNGEGVDKRAGSFEQALANLGI